jgi:glycine betaine/proline transport system ATP-binding protein
METKLQKTGTENQQPMLRCDGVFKFFGRSAGASANRDLRQLNDAELREQGLVAAVRDASFEVARGETFVIMGLSGSGKSTLLRCLTRLIEPTYGSVVVDGADVTAADDRKLMEIRRRKMGMVFQHFALLPNRSVLGNVLFPMQIQGIDAKTANERALELLTLVGLQGLEHRRPSELSGGQQQRVGIARSLATDPPVWFLDEPFSALDPLIRMDLQAELLRLQATLAKTTVFVTHDLDEAIRLADRIAIMEHGRIVQIGTPEELVLNPATAYVKRFVSKVPLSKVVSVGRLMKEGTPPANAMPLPADRVIGDLAEDILGGPDVFAVTRSDGGAVGVLEKKNALRVLANLETNIS